MEYRRAAPLGEMIALDRSRVQVERASSNEPKRENYKDGKDKEDNRRNPVARAYAHGGRNFPGPLSGCGWR